MLHGILEVDTAAIKTADFKLSHISLIHTNAPKTKKTPKKRLNQKEERICRKHSSSHRSAVRFLTSPRPVRSRYLPLTPPHPSLFTLHSSQFIFDEVLDFQGHYKTLPEHVTEECTPEFIDDVCDNTFGKGHLGNLFWGILMMQEPPGPAVQHSTACEQ